MKSLFLSTKLIFALVPVFYFSLVPLPLFAASCPDPGALPNRPSAPKDFGEFICILLNMMNTLFPIMVGATLVVFFWGLIKFIYAAGDEKKIADGKQLIIWGIIGLFVMVSIWGIINLLYADFIGGGPIKLPILPTGDPADNN